MQQIDMEKINEALIETANQCADLMRKKGIPVAPNIAPLLTDQLAVLRKIQAEIERLSSEIKELQTGVTAVESEINTQQKLHQAALDRAAQVEIQGHRLNANQKQMEEAKAECTKAAAQTALMVSKLKARLLDTADEITATFRQINEKTAALHNAVPKYFMDVVQRKFEILAFAAESGAIADRKIDQLIAFADEHGIALPGKDIARAALSPVVSTVAEVTTKMCTELRYFLENTKKQRG